MSDKKNHALFSIIFEDGSYYSGGDNYFNTKWKNIPDKPIKRIFYRLPGGDYLTLSGYEAYYHMIEGTKDWMKVSSKKAEKLSNQTRIEYAYIMGKVGNKVRSYRITLLNRPNGRYKLGDILKREFTTDNKLIKGLNPIGWKNGSRALQNNG
jgi:hypothetical protein